MHEMKICLLGQSKTKTNLKQKFTESILRVGQSKKKKRQQQPETKVYRVSNVWGHHWHHTCFSMSAQDRQGKPEECSATLGQAPALAHSSSQVLWDSTKFCTSFLCFLSTYTHYLFIFIYFFYLVFMGYVDAVSDRTISGTCVSGKKMGRAQIILKSNVKKTS